MHARWQPVKMLRAAVNPQVALIFNGDFETWKSAENAEKFAEMRPKNTWWPAVYLARIYHDGASARIKSASTFERTVHGAEGLGRWAFIVPVTQSQPA